MGVDFSANVVFGVVLPEGYEERLRKLTKAGPEADDDSLLDMWLPKSVGYCRAGNSYSGDRCMLLCVSKAGKTRRINEFVESFSATQASEEAVEALKEAARALGVKEPRPQWLLLRSIW